MLTKILTKIFGSRNERIIDRLFKEVEKINKFELDFEKLSDYELKSKTNYFRNLIDKGENIEKFIPEVFTTVREVSKRVFGMRHFDVQLIGGMVLNEGCIAEMRTGEGKTLTSTLPAYINALSRKGVHIVTVNDYLAKRDAKNNRKLFEFLGLTVGVTLPGMSQTEKRKAYAADITYGTNNEFGFDYLRDNMVFDSKERVQRNLNYALIDEVDSILIDEARTPLIISGPTEDTSELYIKIDKIIPYLKRQEKEDSDFFQGKGHFSIDEKLRQITLTERGLILIENLLIKEKLMKEGESLYSSSNIILMHHVMAGLRAHTLFTVNVDYIVKNKQIIIVDEHTGRTMEGRRWSDGLHQAIEAKEHVDIQNENQTLASITFQNYFRLYKKLAGMTGTADTEAFEFSSIYKLDTIVIPTNKPMIRNDLPDLVYMTEKEKISSIINDIKKRISNNQPVLVGTISIEKSELISNALKKEKILHNVLNAKFHATEADIIANAGQAGVVTIATNMAGRGTDIILGGNWQNEIDAIEKPTQKQILQIKKQWEIRHKNVISSGGLHVIGTERHESRRIDNQLRGRSGRQGDPGSSRFYLSLEDSLMRIFASNRITSIMKKLGMKQGEAIEHRWVTKAIENAQRKVENRNFDIRKQLLEYDDVSNDQRRVIYKQRNELLNGNDIKETINNIYENIFTKIINCYIPHQSAKESWDINALEKRLIDDFNIKLSIKNLIHKNSIIKKEKLHEYIIKKINDFYEYKEKVIGAKIMRDFEKNIMLQTLDLLWKEHLASIDYLRQGIHLRGYAQKDPKQEYKRESFNMFENMLESLKYDVVSTLFKTEFNFFKNIKELEHFKNIKFLIKKQQSNLTFSLNNSKTKKINKKNKISRNEICPCNSGKKYKHCHGRSI
ncbi:preprotein translocase subunit SecA [Candidatus Providencia siddallii]|uniref:Protein translocase subunit SecA n=1 Tax=Candidatus Providencia siddallii TaxID=1715285 RepID=A0ABM9NP14_9GAMM